MPGRALNSVIYEVRPPASVRAARAAWDLLVEAEERPTATTRFGNMGSAGVATMGPEIPPRRRRPMTMARTFADYWIWLMEFDDGDFEEIECRFVLQKLAKASQSAVT